MTIKQLLATGTVLLFATTLSAAEPVRATEHKGANIKITIDDINAAKDAAQNKKAVMEQMMRFFLERKPPAFVSSQPLKEAKPEFKIIDGEGGMATLIYRCRYIDPEFLTDAIDAVVTDAGYVELVKKLGSEASEFSTIVIFDRAEKMEELKKILLSLDVLQPQVLVEAQVIEVYSEQGAERDVRLTYQYYDADYDTTNNFGFNLDSPVQNRLTGQGGGFNFVPFAHKSSDGSSGQLTAAIRWLNTSRNARILSAPNVIAAQGAEATITTAEELPIPESSTSSSSTNLSIKYKQVGVTLKITPELISQNTVQLSVNPQVRSVLRYEAFSMNEVISNIPVISLRSVDTKLTVADGDIIILGGLYNSEKSETLRKVPYLGDIPILSDLINGRDSSSVDKQLLFLLKVHIIQPGKMINLDPDATAQEIHKTAEILEQSRRIFTNKPATKFVDIEAEINEEAKRRREKLEDERAFLQELDQIVDEKKKEGK